MLTINFGPDTPADQVIEASEISVRLPETPVRYYWHGWQSWSLASWVDAAQALPIPRPALLHPMQLDPAHATLPSHHGSWVGAIETPAAEVLLLGSLALEGHVSFDGKELRGRYEVGSGAWFVARGQEKAVFSQYAARLGEILGRPSIKAIPRVWCSWYSLYTAIDQQLILQVLRDLGDLPFDVIQVDDGWQQAVGDWEPNARFPSGMKSLAARIRATGRRAGLWLAPLIAVRSSRLVHEHRDWFLRDQGGRLASAGFNWGERLHALDTTHPQVLEWLQELIGRVRGWGFDYLKLDFLYGGALPGKRHADMPREAAYRQGLHAVREAAGDAYLLACGAPILPSLGLCDALRIGPDVAAHWESERNAVLLRNPSVPGTRNAIRTTLNRLWLRPLVQPDPDMAYFRSVDCRLTPQQKRLLRGLALVCGFRATSDLPQWLTNNERMELRQFLEADPQIAQVESYKYRVADEEIDFEAMLDLPETPRGWKSVLGAALGQLANREWALRLNYEMDKRALAKRIAALKRPDTDNC